MKNYYSISIPEPCHEDWNKMTPKDKGRFCNSCVKTVVDFTKMNTYEIQDFINDNKNNRICGHFKQSQLDSINIYIPSKFLEQRQNFHKTFLLALLIVMGTTLMNCTNKKGNKQKIDSIEVIDTLNNNRIDILGGIGEITEIDSIPKKSCKTKPKEETIIDLVTDGELVIEPVGDVVIIEQPPISIDSLNIPYNPEIDDEIIVTGALIETDSSIKITPTWCPTPETDNKETTIGFLIVETPPEFKGTPKNLSIQEKRNYFSKRISEVVSKNFNTTVCSDLKGKQKVHTQFKIDENGNIIDIKARAPHPLLEKEAKRVLKLLPQFIPARQRDKPITVVYSLPFIFQVEE
ncbi:energy transducer TonB [Thalassobellus citreus]|uniref:energy transducer TonB n=1 Tax=Thalassobellus citreus TaxID=3367752 RepID=UPI0037945CDD